MSEPEEGMEPLVSMVSFAGAVESVVKKTLPFGKREGKRQSLVEG